MGTLRRLVESQAQAALSEIVDTLKHQAILAAMLDEAELPAPAGSPDLHHLLAAPFRSPPLLHGSRFGPRYEPSLFYGSLTLDALFAETAYYRLVFWYGMMDPPEDRYLTRHVLFKAGYRTAKGLRLQDSPFNRYRKRLRDPADYTATQALGENMRQAGIEAFECESAREPHGDLNVALFAPRALATKTPKRIEEWLCETAADTVSFYSRPSRGVYTYAISVFQVRGKLPEPAM
jgi:hypothetical protein